MAITSPPTISGFTGVAPNRTEPEFFSARTDTYLGEMQPNIDSQNVMADWMEVTGLEMEAIATDSLAAVNQAVSDGEDALDLKIVEVNQIVADANIEIDEKVTEAADSADIAQSAAGLANYQGEYLAGETYSKGETVSDIEGTFYISVVDLNTGNALDNTSFWLITAGGSSTGERLTFTKSFALNERADYTMEDAATIPIVSVTKEVATTGETNNKWDVDASEYEQGGTDLVISPDVKFDDLGGGTYPTDIYATAITTANGQINTNFWTQLNTLIASETLNNQSISYALSADGKESFQIGLGGHPPRSIAKNNAGAWQINTNADFDSETWVDSVVNDEFSAVSESADIVTPKGFYLESAVYDSISFSVSSEESSPQDVAFSTDGLKMFVIGSQRDTVYQYTLTDSFDVSTASYSGVSFDTTLQDSYPTGLSFNPTGTKLYISGRTTESVYQYTLSTGFDLTTASYDSVSFSVDSQVSPSRTQAVTFNGNGTKMFISSLVGIYQYTLSTGFDLTTASYDSVSFSVDSQDASMTSLFFSSDGYILFTSGSQKDFVYKYKLTSPFDLSSASYDFNFSIAAQTGAPIGLSFSVDGTKMFVIVDSTDTVFQYSTETLIHINQMNSTQLNALTTSDQVALGTELDLAVTLYTDDASETPVFEGMEINYDANVRNQAAIEGTDYEWWSYGENDITIKALAANNLKGRVL